MPSSFRSEGYLFFPRMIQEEFDLILFFLFSFQAEKKDVVEEEERKHKGATENGPKI